MTVVELAPHQLQLELVEPLPPYRAYQQSGGSLDQRTFDSLPLQSTHCVQYQNIVLPHAQSTYAHLRQQMPPPGKNPFSRYEALGGQLDESTFKMLDSDPDFTAIRSATAQDFSGKGVDFKPVSQALTQGIQISQDGLIAFLKLQILYHRNGLETHDHTQQLQFVIYPDLNPQERLADAIRISLLKDNQDNFGSLREYLRLNNVGCRPWFLSDQQLVKDAYRLLVGRNSAKIS